MAKLLKLRRGTTTQHGSFTGAEGEVTIDTTKDTAVVHDGSTTGGTPLAKEDMSNVSSASIAGRLSNDSIAVSKIAAGTLPSDVKIQDANVSGNLTIVNADVTSSAAIAGTKIAPDFGGQDVTTTANLNSANLVLSHTTPTIQLNDSNDNPDYVLQNNNGAFRIRDNSNSVDRIVVNTDGHVDVAGNLDVGSGIDVTGNITATGTVDGRDVASDGSKLDGIESGATADQTAAEIRTLVESASDSNVFTDADHSKLNGIESGATADQSGSEIASALQGQNIANSTNGINNIYNDGWFRSNISGNGLYNQATGQHFYSDHDDYWNIAGGSSANAVRFRDEHAGTIRGYVYANNSNQIGFLNSSANWSLLCDNSGNVTATGNVTAYSDARLKTNVNTINDALGIVGKLRGVSFDWKESGERSIGVIAQEVEKVLPELVLTSQVLDPTGESEVKSVDYGKIVGVLINAINELKEEVEELKNAKITG